MLQPSFDKEDRQRLHGSEEDHRPAFLRDLDRLIHRPAFRRLQGKTQVVTPGQADFFRTRLTHTLEVAQLSRDVVSRLFQSSGERREQYLPASWQELATAVEASSILHDLGHPPFGHAGEVALGRTVDELASEWSISSVGLGVPDPVGGFEGNAQSFHLAVEGLSRSGDTPGLDLTRTVLDGAIKYPWERGQADSGSHAKWCFYPTDDLPRKWVRDPVPPERDQRQSFESQVVDWADDVAYVVHDVEDWFKARFLRLDVLARSPDERKSFAEDVRGRWAEAGVSETDRHLVDDAMIDLFVKENGPFEHIKSPYDGSASSKEAVRCLRERAYTYLLEQIGVASQGEPTCRHHNDLEISPKIRVAARLVRELIRHEVLDDLRMGTAESGHASVVSDLLRIHAAATQTGNLTLFPRDVRNTLKRLEEAGDRVRILRAVCDYVAGMTDAYAIKVHGRLLGYAPGIFNEFM